MMIFTIQFKKHKNLFLTCAIADSYVICDKKRFSKNNILQLFEWMAEFNLDPCENNCIAVLENDFYDSGMNAIINLENLTCCDILLIKQRTFTELDFVLNYIYGKSKNKSNSENKAMIMATAIKFMHQHFVCLWSSSNKMPF